MMFITIWIWSFAIVMFLLMYNCYKNPGKMYLDVFALMALIVAIPGIAIWALLHSIYARIFVYRSKEDREALNKKTWQQVEDIHNTLQMLKGKF